MSDHGEEKERMDPRDAESSFELWNCRDCVSGYFPDIGGCLLNEKERRHIMDLNRQLYRSDTNKILFGVCGGLGEYFNIDPTIIRLLWVVFACSGTGLIVYLIAALIMPLRPDGRY